ncbi:ribonuclease Y-like [Megalobrama amblycephala]|uniref:ribonuclease Y-like n=1 Tax=Megalobrama amblycephala TaxID=75352 RepID=UPI0020145568|nr:ribonuclease Y-like [Megalobrama amblycephala]
MGGTESSRKAELDKWEQKLDEREKKLDKRVEELDKRVKELDERVKELDKRVKELDKSAMRAGAVSAVQHNSQELETKNDEPTCRRLFCCC